MAEPARSSPEVNLKCDFNYSKRKIELFPLTRPIAKMTAQCAIYVGQLRTPNFGGKGSIDAVGGRGWYRSIERWWVSACNASILHSNFSSIFTRTLQRYYRFCSPACQFLPTEPLVSPKFPHVPLGVGGPPFDYEERMCWANCRAISFQDFQPMWSHSNNVTDRQTDGRHAIARPRFALKCMAR